MVFDYILNPHVTISSMEKKQIFILNNLMEKLQNKKEKRNVD